MKLSNSEVETLLRGVKTYSFNSRDEQEVAGYADLMEMIFASFKDIPFTETTSSSFIVFYSSTAPRMIGTVATTRSLPIA